MATPNTPRLSLSHATIAVGDLDTMLDFYCGVLGFAVEGVIPISHGNAWSLYFNDPVKDPR